MMSVFNKPTWLHAPDSPTSLAPHTKRLGAFTLVEMLVVVCLLGILAVVLLPVFHSVREAANRTTCVSHLLQISLALQMYAEDHRGYYPCSVPPGINCGWPDQLNPYIKDSGVFECASVDNGEYQTGCPTPDITLKPAVNYHGSYSLNWLAGTKTKFHVSQFLHPDHTIVVVDGLGHLINPGVDPTIDIEDLKSHFLSGRHNGGDNALFADRHVKWMRLAAMTDRRLWLAGNVPSPIPQPTP